MRAVLGSIILLLLGFLLFAAFLSVLSHGMPTKARPNTLGVSDFYNNPYTYLLAKPIDGQVFSGGYTNIRFAPYAAADFYDLSILFCGDVSDQFDGKSGVLVIVYKIQGTHKYRGIGCHELVGVFEVKGQ